jgi:nucleotide sugar dehydrogenase
MSSSILHIKPEEIDSSEKRGRYIASIIGCEPIGILHSCLFAETGFKVICTDADQTIVNLLTRGKAPFSTQEIDTKLKNYAKMGRLNATSDIRTAVSQSDIAVIAMSVRIDEKQKPDYSNVKKTCKLVGSSLRSGSLVIIASITGLGVVEGTYREILENASGLKTGVDFGLAYSPIRILQGQTLETIANQERIVAATDKTSLDSASTILQTISKGVRKTSNIKMAEAAVLFEAARHDINVAVANELAIFCEKAGVDYMEAQRLLNPNDVDTSFSPILAVGNDQETYVLLEDAENLGAKLRIASAAKEMNEEIAKHAVNLIKDALRECEKTLRRARISMLGISQIPNNKSPPKKMLKELIALLEARGAKISLYDPYFLDTEVPETEHRSKKSLTEAVEGTDCVMIVTGHDQFKRLNVKKLKIMLKMPAAVVDLEGIFDPDKVEKEGLIYRGLGRGVWKK